MAAALKKAGHEVRYTEFPGVGHNSWVPAYDTTALWPWVFGH
jgi:enterochelin esterase-like enzyme